MRLYHISQTLKLGDALSPGHQRLSDLAEPFLQGLARGSDCFCAMLLNGKYLYAVMKRSGLREWADYAKWATEGLFEYVRRRSFPEAVSRLACGYYYDNLADCRRLYEEDWGEEIPEEREKVRLFAVELEDPAPQRRDMSLYDEAYDAVERQDPEAALELAARYFRGEASEHPVWEILSDKPGKAVEDLTPSLR
ncbi:MAG: hypothetical protein IKQ54_11115 [Oscillospiraceae bacterium]|nr:hypothetical protein [Oscillospiraceae bacterium]